MEIFPRIMVDPEIQGGVPVIKGTRVPVKTVLEYLAKGLSVEDVIAEFDLTKEDVYAALAFAAARIGEERYLIAA